MKKYKYPFYSKILKREYKERFKQLEKEKKKNIIVNKIVYWSLIILYGILVALCVLLTKFVNSLEMSNVLKTFAMIGMIIMIIVMPLAILTLIIFLINKKIPPIELKEISYELIEKITQPLVKYYNISNVHLTTKCYASTENDFVNKDVILFVYNGKLRIVNDIYHSIKDIGCLEFEYNEIKYFNIKEDEVIKTIIKVDDVELTLGYRARTFIRNSFETQYGSKKVS